LLTEALSHPCNINARSEILLFAASNRTLLLFYSSLVFKDHSPSTAQPLREKAPQTSSGNTITPALVHASWRKGRYWIPP